MISQNFEYLGLKKLISTSYAINSKIIKAGIQTSFLETTSPKFDKSKTNTHGKIFVLEKDITGDGKTNLDDLEWDYLEDDGDFRSEEVNLKSASNLNDNLNCSKELEHYAS